MSPTQFRRIALSFPDTEESAHMGHPDFRVRNRIFASLLGDKEQTAMVKLTPDQQAAFMTQHPTALSPASGAWGRAGATMITLKSIRAAPLKHALLAAWRNTAPKRLVDSLGPSDPD
ncbi:MAG TPA: MmcQ/YjbR family DNA-binding protein [Phycisphaerales bacterium]|nr:MmcQ/YjbR family DNA-binding protein [Phycisphaerales bacterium]